MIEKSLNTGSNRESRRRRELRTRSPRGEPALACARSAFFICLHPPLKIPPSFLHASRPLRRVWDYLRDPCVSSLPSFVKRRSPYRETAYFHRISSPVASPVTRLRISGVAGCLCARYPTCSFRPGCNGKVAISFELQHVGRQSGKSKNEAKQQFEALRTTEGRFFCTPFVHSFPINETHLSHRRRPALS